MNEETICLKTTLICQNDYDKGCVAKEISIFPENSDIWSFTQLLLLLNGKDTNKYFMIKFEHEKNANFYVRVLYIIL